MLRITYQSITKSSIRLRKGKILILDPHRQRSHVILKTPYTAAPVVTDNLGLDSQDYTVEEKNKTMVSVPSGTMDTADGEISANISTKKLLNATTKKDAGMKSVNISTIRALFYPRGIDTEKKTFRNYQGTTRECIRRTKIYQKRRKKDKK